MATPLPRYRVNASTFADTIGNLGQVEAETRYLKKSGGAMTGPLVVLDPTANSSQAATKAYADARRAPVGTLIPWAGNIQTAPAGWLACGWGNTVSRTTYAALFSVIGTTYGVGDGSTTFQLPTIQARIPVGYDGSAEFGSLGAMSGSPEHALTSAQVPNASGTITMHNQAGPTIMSGASGMFSGFQGSASTYHSHQNPVSGANSYGGFYWTNNGGGAVHENRQPYIIMQYIIKF